MISSSDDGDADAIGRSAPLSKSKFSTLKSHSFRKTMLAANVKPTPPKPVAEDVVLGRQDSPTDSEYNEGVLEQLDHTGGMCAMRLIRDL